MKKKEEMKCIEKSLYIFIAAGLVCLKSYLLYSTISLNFKKKMLCFFFYENTNQNSQSRIAWSENTALAKIHD